MDVPWNYNVKQNKSDTWASISHGFYYMRNPNKNKEQNNDR